MKKCSKSSHHALAELNITPLLDLAFVLLVIFIITTTPLVNDLDLNLPTASKNQKDPPRKANYVTLLGVDAARERVRHLADQTRAHLDPFGERATYLRASVDFVLDRRA